jgi:hypothetical protein
MSNEFPLMPPPLVPIFYEMKSYSPKWHLTVPRIVDPNYLHFSELSQPHFDKIMHYFNLATFERAGVLYGEYVMYKGLILVGADGMVVKGAMAWEDKWGGNLFCDTFCNSEPFANFKRTILNDWRDIPVSAEYPLVFSHPHANAYYHWTFETVTKNRFFSQWPDNPLLVQARDLRFFYQRDLFTRTYGDKSILLQEEAAIKVRNPIVSHEIMSDNSLHWLREHANIFCKTGGGRRIYLRRSAGKTRERLGGGICETIEFINFIKEYNFEAIDFSDQELSVEAQIRLLDGVSVILAPHGGALTNLAYMNPPLSVIEIISHRTPRALFMHIANTLKLHYYGVYSMDLDDDDNIIVNIDELHSIMRECLALAA